jgi:hypothetical protein
MKTNQNMPTPSQEKSTGETKTQKKRRKQYEKKQQQQLQEQEPLNEERETSLPLCGVEGVEERKTQTELLSSQLQENHQFINKTEEPHAVEVVETLPKIEEISFDEVNIVPTDQKNIPEEEEEESEAQYDLPPPVEEILISGESPTEEAVGLIEGIPQEDLVATNEQSRVESQELILIEEIPSATRFDETNDTPFDKGLLSVSPQKFPKLSSSNQKNIPEEEEDQELSDDLPPPVEEILINEESPAEDAVEEDLVATSEQSRVEAQETIFVEEIPSATLFDETPELDALTPFDKGLLSVSPQKFLKQSPVRTSFESDSIVPPHLPPASAGLGTVTVPGSGVSFMRTTLLTAIQLLSHLHEILIFFRNELKYEFGMSSKDTIVNYSSFIHRWLIPYFVRRNPSLQMVSNGHQSLTTSSDDDGRADNQIITEDTQQMRAAEETHHTTCSPISSLSSNASSSSTELSLSTSEFLLVKAISNLLLACLWTYLLCLFTFAHGSVSSLISKSFSLFWLMTVSMIQSMIWIFLLPITIPLSLCKKMVLYLFPDLKKNRPTGRTSQRETVSHSVFGTL